MTRARLAAKGIALWPLLALGIVSLGLAPLSALASTVLVVQYDGASPGQRTDFQTAPYLENFVTTRVDAGHFELLADAGGASGDLAFNLDEQNHGLAQVTITLSDGTDFDALSLEVVNPAESAGEYTISAIGGGGGSIPAPTTAGTFTFGAGFSGISALVVKQNQAGAFAFDDLTLNALPEPAAVPSLLAAALLLFALHRRRAA